MGGPEAPELGAQNAPPRTSEGESKLSESSPGKWNLGVLESGPGSEGEKANCAFPPSPDKDETTYPEGGVRAWLIVFGSWCAVMTSLGTASSFGSFQSYFIKHKLSSYSPGVVGWIFSVYAFLAFAGGIVVGPMFSYFIKHKLSSYSPGVVGWIFSVYAFLAFAGGIVVGPMFDKYGPKWLVLTGSVGVCSAMFLVGLCKHYWQILLVFGFLGGGGSCLLYTPAIAAIGHYFRKTRGNAIGIALSASAIGGVVFPLMLEHLSPKVGFAWSTRLIGSIYVCLSVIACSLIRSRLPPAKNANAKPDYRIFKDRAFAITVLAVYLLQWAYYVPISYISSYALYHGFSSSFSFLVLVLLNVGSIFGRWLPGFTGDRIGHYNSIILMTIVTVVSVLGVWLPVGQTKAGLVVFALTFGFTSGAILTLTATCIGQLCQIRDYGRYYATAYTVASVGYLTGIPISGELVDRNHGDYGGLIIFVGICYVGALAALVVVRIVKTGWKIMVVY